MCAKCTAPCPKHPALAPVSRRPNAPAAGRGLAGSAWDDCAGMRAQLLSTVGRGVQGRIGISKNTKWSKNVQENSRTFLHHKNVQDFPAKMLDVFRQKGNRQMIAKKFANWYNPTYGKTGQKTSGDCKARP